MILIGTAAKRPPFLTGAVYRVVAAALQGIRQGLRPIRLAGAVICLRAFAQKQAVGLEINVIFFLGV